LTTDAGVSRAACHSTSMPLAAAAYGAIRVMIALNR
jgi:hypothetical protein